MNTILFVRHGQSQANAAKIIATAATPLSELGKEQATETGQRLRGQQVTKIVSSPYVRARQTAEIIAHEIGYDVNDIVIINELRERGFGEKEGQPKDHESTWYYEVDDEYGIESHQAVIARMQHALEQLQIATRQTAGTLLVVGHATAGFYLRQVANGRLNVADFDSPEDQKNAAIAELII